MLYPSDIRELDSNRSRQSRVVERNRDAGFPDRPTAEEPSDTGIQSTPHPASSTRRTSWADPAHYSPAIDRQIVCALYHEAKRQRKPMTRLVNELLAAVLRDTHGWQTALDQSSILQEQPREEWH